MKKIKLSVLFLVLLIFLIGAVSSAQLQEDSTSSTSNEATKIVEKTSTISQTDSITEKNTTIQTSMNSLDIVANSNKNKTLKDSSLNGDLLHSTGDFYAANIDDVTYSNVKADGNNMSADVLIRNDNPTLKFKLDEQVISLKLETNDRNPSEVKILSGENITYPDKLKVSYQITNMTDNATYVIIDEDSPEQTIVKEGIITDAQSTLTVENIKPGKYIIRINNHANASTKSSYALAHFKVSYKEVSATVTADNVTYGNPTTIKLTADGDGTYIVTVGASLIQMDVVNGICEKLIKFDVGNYQTQTSSLDYVINCNEASFHVDKAVNNVVVEVENVSYGELSNIKVKADVDGSCDVRINGTTYNIPVSNGVGNKSVQLNAGKFYANVSSYYGNKIFLR